jgi:1-acyl-sn-glycerol-3-phosphate acyltransferase
LIYRFLRFLFSLALKVFFRRIEVEGLERVPPEGPVLLVPNHPNALVDALVILMKVKRPVSLTAKNTLANNLLLRLLMDAAHVVRLHRKQDARLGADRSKNLDALEECRRRLGDGGALMLFPEGMSHSESSLRPFRWGAGRLALQCDADHTPLTIIPVGLHFPRKERIRSDAWIRFGQPIDVNSWRRENPQAGHEELTGEIERRVRDITLNFEKRTDEVLLNWTAELLITGGMPPVRLGEREAETSRRLALARLLQEGYEFLKSREGSRVAELRKRVLAYRSELIKLGVTPAEVYIIMSRRLAIRFVLREAAILLLGLPLALWGILNHILPAAGTRLVERKLDSDRDQVASNIIFPAIVFFPLCYALFITAAWLNLPPAWAAAYTISLPYCGYTAVLYLERAGGCWLRTRTFLKFQQDPELKERLETEGRTIIKQLQELGSEMGGV